MATFTHFGERRLFADKRFSNRRKFALTNQIKRAAVSVISNIAEGSSRSSLKDQVRFLEMAYGSLMEIYSQLCIAWDLEYIDENTYQKTNPQIKEISNKLNALRNSYIRKQESNNQTNK